MKKLTRKQAAVAAMIKQLTTAKGYPPTVRELADAMGIGWPNGMESHLKALERKGAITREARKPRTLRVTAD